MPDLSFGNCNAAEHQSDRKAITQKTASQPVSNQYACTKGNQHTAP